MHELWITSLFNRTLAAPANLVLNSVGIGSPDPAHPWSDWLACEIVVVVAIVILFLVLRSRLSVDRPGKLQHTMELVYEFVRASAEEIGGPDAVRFTPFFGTIFVFILVMNLSGLIPGIDSPTQFVMVPFGLALTTFVFYHAMGIRANGFAYIKQFMGPMLGLAWLLLPIELISHFSRPLSLTVRLYANMFAGEQVYSTFLAVTKVLIPVVFIGLHTFVGMIQAYIFMLLAMVYVSAAISHEDH